MEEYVERERLLLFYRESEFIMTPDYCKNSKARHYRERALDHYQKVHNPRTMDALVLYVAMNFFDRVISRLGAPPKIMLNKQENFDLFLNSCHSISWKLRDNKFDIYKFLAARKYKFGDTGLMKMETAILKALDWKTKQTLPFHFLPYFLQSLNLPPGFTRLPVHKIIIWTQADIRFTKFRPSAVAASAILCALAKLFPDDSTDFATVILSGYPPSYGTIRDELAECEEMIQRTYENKMNTLVVATGLINDGVETSHPLNLASGEASTVPPESSKESLEEGSQRQRKETVAEEASEGIVGIETVLEQSLRPASGQESPEDGSQKEGIESVADKASTTVGETQAAPKQSSSAGDGRLIPLKRSHRAGKEPVDEGSREATGEIQQSSSPDDAQESPVKCSHRPGKEPIDEEFSEATRKNTSSDDPGVGFCRRVKVRKAEIEETQVAVVDELLMNFELGWDDQNPYSHGYGMWSLCDALAKCWPIPIYEAQEQTLDWLRQSWEWLLKLPQHIGIPDGQATRGVGP